MRSPEEFRSVLRGGRRAGAGGIVVHVRERDGGGLPRLGLVVPKAVGTAVTRNRVKRRLRVIWRAARPGDPVDCVVVVRPAAAGLPFGELRQSFQACLRRIDCRRPEPPGPGVAS